MRSRQRYKHRIFLVYTQDTIEGVSGLGSIAELLRGELVQKHQSSCASWSNHSCHALGSGALTSNPCKMLTHVHKRSTLGGWQVGSKGEVKGLGCAIFLASDAPGQRPVRATREVTSGEIAVRRGEDL